MEKIDTFRMYVRPGRTYMHDDHEFVVKTLTMVKAENTASETWKPAVVYERVKTEDGQQVMTFTRSLEDFLSKFVPQELEVGDFVEAISMNKSRGFLKVSEITDGVASFHLSDLKADVGIDVKSLKINMRNPTQATDYYLLVPQETAADYYRMIDNIVRKIAEYRGALDNAESASKRAEARKVIKRISELINND